ncbi:hypothetical protein [Nonlabens sp. Asnod3-A02]|uniref:hypothetical protein n=1 Tax=Nonlabens sp. Asnod3-A02 TaxID=3160579 RepID=UPI00386C926A
MRLPIILILLIICSSCNETKNAYNKSKDAISSSADYLDSTLIKQPIKYFEDRSAKSDSVERKKLADYYSFYGNKYPEYNAVRKWFESNPPQTQNLDGNFYKIINSIVTDSKDVERKNHEMVDDFGTYKYFYETEDFHFIYDLQYLNSEIKCKGVRRISSGIGEESMYDLIFDDFGILKKEIFQSEVNPEFYEEDEMVFFEFSKEVGDREVVNLINLGKTIE